MTALNLSDRRQTIDSRTGVSVPILTQIIAWIVGMMLFYSAVNARISVVETQQTSSEKREDQMQQQMNRIERKLDQALERGR